MLDIEATTTGYPGARRSAEVVNCDFFECVLWTEQREKIVSNASITDFAREKDVMHKRCDGRGRRFNEADRKGIYIFVLKRNL